MSDSDRSWSASEVIGSLRADSGSASAVAKERVLKRLGVTVGGFATGAAVLDGLDAPLGAEPAPPLGLAPAAGPPAALVWFRPSVLALTFAAGVATGAVAFATLRPKPAPVIIPADRAVVAAPAAPMPSAATAPSSSGRSSDLADGPQNHRASGFGPLASSATNSRGNLAAEQALLDVARASLGRGDSGAALREIGTHRRRFPKSALTEEREALAIKALVLNGNYDEAKERGVRFGERYPNSVLLSSIKDTLATIP
jgi:hypothetical protein